MLCTLVPYPLYVCRIQTKPKFMIRVIEPPPTLHPSQTHLINTSESSTVKRNGFLVSFYTCLLLCSDRVRLRKTFKGRKSIKEIWFKVLKTKYGEWGWWSLKFSDPYVQEESTREGRSPLRKNYLS